MRIWISELTCGLRPLSAAGFQSSLKTKAKSKYFGRIVRQSRTLAANQRDMPRKRPPVESVYDIGEAGRGLSQVGGIDLRDVAQAHHLGARARAGDQRLHLLGREILGLIDNNEAVQECTAPHEIQGANLDAVPEQIVGRAASPRAPALALRQHFQ